MKRGKIFFHHNFRSRNVIYNIFLIKTIRLNKYQIKVFYIILFENKRTNNKY